MSKVEQMIAEQQKGFEYTDVYTVGEQLKDICRREPHCAKLLEEDLKNKSMSLEAAATKAKAEKEEAEARAKEAVEKLEAAQKAQKIADPDLTAVQLLGQQMLSTWNTMQGHRKKAVAKNPDNAAPLEAFLRQLIKTMEGSIDGTAG